MKHFLFPLVIFPVIALSACHSRAIPVREAKTAPQVRVFDYQQSADSTLIVMRDQGVVGSGCDASVFINGKVVAKLEPGEMAKFHLNTGDWIIGASLESAGLCALNPVRQERETILKKGDTKVFRVSMGNSGVIDILPTTL